MYVYIIVHQQEQIYLSDFHFTEHKIIMVINVNIVNIKVTIRICTQHGDDILIFGTSRYPILLKAKHTRAARNSVKTICCLRAISFFNSSECPRAEISRDYQRN